MAASPSSALFIRDKKVKVKLTGDGTNIGKHLHVVPLQSWMKVILPGNHCIAIFKEAEHYGTLKLCLQDIIQDVEKLTSILVGEIEFAIDYYLGGDWKFLAMVTGIDCATSTYAYIWCKCPAIERYGITQKWSISNVEYGARTMEENTRISQSRGMKYNVSNSPLFRTIPLTHVVVDNLHMFLRVADTLIDMLLLELRRLDKIEKTTKIKKNFTTLRSTKVP